MNERSLEVLLLVTGVRAQVKWLNGSVSWVWPCEVFVVSQDDPWMDQDGAGSEGLSGSDWETVGSDEGPSGVPNNDGLDAADVMAQLDRLNAVSRVGHEREEEDDDDYDGEASLRQREAVSWRREGDADSDATRARYDGGGGGHGVGSTAARGGSDEHGRAHAGETDGKSSAGDGKASTFYAGASIRHVWSAVGSGLGALFQARAASGARVLEPDPSDVPARIKFLLSRLIKTADLKTLTTKMCMAHVRESFENGESIVTEYKQLIRETIHEETQKRTRLGAADDAEGCRVRADAGGGVVPGEAAREAGAAGADPNGNARSSKEDTQGAADLGQDGRAAGPPTAAPPPNLHSDSGLRVGVASASVGDALDQGREPVAEEPAAKEAREEGQGEDEDEDEDEDEEEDGSFEVVPALPGHKFEAAGGAAANAPSKEFVKCVRKEWKLLRSSLPKGIYVRVSEQRCVEETDRQTDTRARAHTHTHTHTRVGAATCGLAACRWSVPQYCRVAGLQG